MEKRIIIEGMKCSGCANRVKNALEAIKEIKKCNVNLANKEAVIVYKKSVDDTLIKDTITSLGFSVERIEEK